MSKLLLKGVRIADFTWIGAGSFTTKLLADFGADVIKIESAERLDSLRLSRPFKSGVEGVNRSGYFSDRNSSKRSITLNLKTSEGIEVAKRLIAASDIVANNFTPGTMEKFGLGYEAVRSFRPDIIYLAMSMQGAAGPDHQYLGYGLTIGALTGLQSICGFPEREPAGTGTNYPDHIPNPCHAAFATLAAIRHRRRTGEGQLIDVAQTEPTVALLGPTVLDFTANGRVAERTGNDRPHAFPHGVFPCAGTDRWIAISVNSAQAWNGLIDAIHGPNWLRDASLADLDLRRERRNEIEAVVTAFTRDLDADDLMILLQSRGVPAGVVRTAQDIVERDSQLEHRRHWVSLDHPEMGSTVYNAPPFRMTEVAPAPRYAAPLLGQHTDDVLSEVLHLQKDEIEALRERGALR